MKCDVCRSENQVRHITNIYTIGSEGTRLCNDCCICVSNYIRELSNATGRITFEIHRQYAKLRSKAKPSVKEKG